MHKGRCLCGAVTYAISGEPGAMGHCHCRMCQKNHGTAFATYVQVRHADFTVLTGQSELTIYRSSANIVRTFCRVCGSNIQFIREGQSYFGLAAGTLDSDPGTRPSYQIWTSCKAPWWTLQTDLVSHETEPDER